MAWFASVLVLTVISPAQGQTLNEPTLNFTDSFWQVTSSRSSLFNASDFFKLDGIIDSAHKKVKAISIQGTSPDHEITFGPGQTAGRDYIWQLTVDAKGQQFRG